MENAVDWQGAIYIMAIALGCFTGAFGMLGLAATVVDQRAEQSEAERETVRPGARSLALVADSLMLVHAGALVTCGALARRARALYSAHLRIVFRVGIPLVMLRAGWNLFEQWSVHGLPSPGRGAGLLIALGALWPLGWSAVKIGLFAWAARYLGRESETHAFY